VLPVFHRGAGLAALFAVGWAIAGAAPIPVAASNGRAAAPSDLQQPVVIDAAVSKVDYQSDTASFENIVVAQGGTRVTAERAQAAGLDFKSSRWTFEGDVLMTMPPRGTLRCDQAIVQIRDDRVAQATATGNPARFEQQRANSRGAVQGHADRIVYDAKADTVRLSGHARVSDGRNEITGPLLVYSLREESVTALSPGQSRGIHITVVRSAPAGKSPTGGSSAKRAGAR
jgi:lipopolysaccharide transport protein LptA